MITLREMTNDDFARFREWSINDYAVDLIKSEMTNKENAYITAEKEFNELLPMGLLTVDNYLYFIVNENSEDVGFVWYLSEGIAGFVCDFWVKESYRNKGYGFQTMKMIEKDAIERGINKVSLNVFKYNKPACNLYIKLDYMVVEDNKESMIMEKILV